jgi:hypothetical protein
MPQDHDHRTITWVLKEQKLLHVIVMTRTETKWAEVGFMSMLYRHLRIEDIVALSSKGALRGDERLKDVACINGIASPSAGEEWPGMDRWTLGEFHTAVRWMLSSVSRVANPSNM